MRKISSVLILLFSISLLCTRISAQEPNLNRLIESIEKGEIEKVKVLLFSLEKDNPNSLTVKYLKALLTENGTEAAKLYREIVHSDEYSEIKDDAIYRLYQYYYSKGDYSESDKYARMLKDSFPNSEFVKALSKRVNYFSSSIDKMDDNQKSSNEKDKNTGEIQSLSITQIEKKSFSIQVGAFSSRENAMRFSSQFREYSVKIGEKEMDGKKLFVVLLGLYDSEEKAKSDIQIIKDKFKIEGIVVSNN